MSKTLKKDFFKKADDRTKKYMQTVLENKGFLGMNSGWDSIKKEFEKNNINFEMVSQYDMWANLTGSGKVDIYEYKKENKTRYAAEFCFRIDIDDYNITSYIFTKKPTKQDIYDMKLLEELHLDFNFNEIEPEFQCWECGHETHWLDINTETVGTDLESRIDAWKDKYCGC